MSGERKRVERLLARLEEVNREVMRTCESCSEDQLQETASPDARPVGVVFHHIAVAYSIAANWAVQIINGEALPDLSMEAVNNFNAEHAADKAGITKADALRALEEHAAKATELLSPLSDEQMNKTSSSPVFGIPGVKAGSLFNAAAIEHAKGHLHSIRTGLGLQG